MAQSGAYYITYRNVYFVMETFEAEGFRFLILVSAKGQASFRAGL